VPSCQVWGAWSVHVVCIGVLRNFLLLSKVGYLLSLITLVIDCNHNTMDMFAHMKENMQLSLLPGGFISDENLWLKGSVVGSRAQFGNASNTSWLKTSSELLLPP